ncbi:hypothetical protein ASPWEDRAFT_35347 [Aspergillus wentii DTO 134E9]|uniref:Uncharacterized protein n=1 Tax=Aspergillus wentii DTO 134E9 TaxID=1073089 RepID=A0A1L9S3N0_ASPWE|nr:uncharacterized protein ASPWEDRAFT_35347 [Aspergillus wentii DTO 134E9]KAI9930081.1 hypothetical protein MW887_011891 [Aspergillus wentii]OJJ41743.1 hypothetical protein ASPWEDRAFT_35347 [Aspergillus wentii DTO 134E9]
MSYSVYRVAESGLPRDHHLIFVETHEQGPQTGHLYNVIGEIQNGMIFEHRAAEEPEKSPVFFSKEEIGTVTHADYSRFLPVCQEIPVPKKQFQGAKRLYPNEPLRRCQEWADEAIQGLVDAKVLQRGGDVKV